MKISLIGSYQDCCPKGYTCLDQYHADVIYRLLKKVVADGEDTKIFTVRSEPFNFFGGQIARKNMTPDQFIIKIIGMHETWDTYFDDDGFLCDFPFGFFEPDLDD